MKTEITLGPNSGNASIRVDGKELANLVGAMRLTRADGAVTLVASADTYPTLELTLVLKEVSVSKEGDLTVNTEPVSDEVGRAIYRTLKARYED